MPAVQRDTGLGTAYERIAVAGVLESLAARHALPRVLEGPADGITGIRGLNSVPFARLGSYVEVVLPDRDEAELALTGWRKLGLTGRFDVRCSSDLTLSVPPASFDLVWNFNCLPMVPDPARLLDDMCEASRRFVLVFVSNTWNYGFPVHRLHHRVAREPWTHGNIATMNARLIANMFRRRGLRVVESLLVDTPWWPDIDSPIEEVAATFLPFLSRFVGRSKRLEKYTWGIDELPYLDHAGFAELAEEMDHLFRIERLRLYPLKVFFAHHRGVLAEKPEMEKRPLSSAGGSR